MERCGEEGAFYRPPELEIRAVQAIASRYTFCAILLTALS